MNTLTYWLQNEGVTILFIILGAVVLYFGASKLIGLIVAQLVKNRYQGQHRKDIEKRQKTLVSLVLHIWRIVVVIVAVISIFKVIFPSLDLAPLFASAGIIGIAIAFGSQTLVKDLLTGIFIVAENQYRVGDVVEINTSEGRVERVGTRSTILRDTEGNVHYIPNGSIVRVINKTMGYSRVHFSLSLASGTDLAKAQKIIDKAGAKLAEEPEWKKKIIEAPQFDSVEALTKNAVEVVIVGKVQPSDQWSVTSELRRRLLEAFTKAGIELG